MNNFNRFCSDLKIMAEELVARRRETDWDENPDGEWEICGFLDSYVTSDDMEFDNREEAVQHEIEWLLSEYGSDFQQVGSEEVLGFINRFTANDTRQQVTEAFTAGCCYWFAFILAQRFSDFAPVIVYDCVQNHFGTRISGAVYDITGIVTDSYDWVPFAALTDEAHLARLKRDCIMF